MKQSNTQKALAGLEAFAPEKNIKVTRDETLEKTVETLSEIYKKSIQLELMELFKNGFYLSRMNELDALNITPQAIFDFVAKLNPPEVEADYPMRTGWFISAITQRSYDAGHNNFEIYVGGLGNLRGIFSNIVGDTQRRIKLKILGDLGERCLSGLKNCDVKLIGNVGESACNNAYLSDFEISGSVGQASGQNSRYSKFRLLGDVGQHFGVSSFDCTFVHSSEKVLDSIRKYKYASKNNKYCILIDGQEIPYTTAYRLKQFLKRKK